MRRARRRDEWRLRRHELHDGLCRSRRPLEEVVEDKGVKIFIDPKAIMFLIGTEMDFVRDKLGGALRLQQSEPDGRLRLRRVGLDHAGKRRLVPLTRSRADVAFSDLLPSPSRGEGNAEPRPNQERRCNTQNSPLPLRERDAKRNVEICSAAGEG